MHGRLVVRNKFCRSSIATSSVLVSIVALLSIAAAPTEIPRPSERLSSFQRLELGPVSPLNTSAASITHVAYSRLPLMFEANDGQTDSQVKFVARAGSSALFLTATEAVLVLTRREARAEGAKFRLGKPILTQSQRATQAVVRMKLIGANPAPRVTGLEKLPGKVNYFIGNDPTKWRTNIATYAKVRHANVYPGIDLVYYGNQRELEYDFVLYPGADPKRIALEFEGVDKLEVDAQGVLVLHTVAGAIRQRKPIVYQEIDGTRFEIPGAYAVKGARQIGFQVAAYDPTRPLVIDPVLSYSTYLGGSAREESFGFAVDRTGSAYVTGQTYSTDFPATQGAFQTTSAGSFEVFVTKLDPTGSALVYSTYLGGNGPG